MTTSTVGYTMKGMRSLGLGVLALVLLAGCKTRRRYDGTCKVDADCLEFQKCSADVCVRKSPLFAPYKSQPVPQNTTGARKPRKPMLVPNTPEPPSDVDRKKSAPPSVRPDLGPAVPRQRDPAKWGRFRLDA